MKSEANRALVAKTKLTTLLMTLMLMSTALWADETVTVSANSSDISEGLDLKVVAKLFAEAKNLEEFEMMLNNPDSAFCNLDLNGDGQVDYLRVVETGEGNKRLIVLQAILAKDIYQDVASIYVEKDEKDKVSVQVVGDEYIYGTNYIIEPVYVYRPLIYDWFWCDAWYAWHSPWYWGYYPGWWYAHRCWACDAYWHHCYAFHHHHHCCSFRHGYTVCAGYHELSPRVTRREYAAAHPDRSFERRNSGKINARDIRSTTSLRGTRQVAAGGGAVHQAGATRGAVNNSSRTFGSANTASTRSAATRTAASSGRSTATATTTRSAGTRSTATAATATRSTASTATATRSTGTRTTAPTTATTTRSAGTRSTASVGRTTRTTSTASTATTTRSAGTRSTASTYSGASRTSSSSYGGTRSSGGYSGGATRSSGGGSMGGGTRSSGGGGGGHVTRR